MKHAILVLLFLCQLALAAAQYYCPMRCEKTKVYSKPGTCPVCHMDLEPVTQAKLEVLSSLDYRVDLDVGQDPADGKMKVVFSPKMTKTGEPVKNIQKARAYIVAQDLSTLDNVALTAEGGSFTGVWSSTHTGNFIAYFMFVPDEGKKQTFPLAIKVGSAAEKAKPLIGGKDGKLTIPHLGTVSIESSPKRVKPNQKMTVKVKIPFPTEDTDLVPFGVSEDTTQLAAIHEGTRGEFHVTFPKSGAFKIWMPLKIKNGPVGWATRVVRVAE
jgi:hypothetical protein